VKRILILMVFILMVFAVGCNSATNTGGGGSTDTSMNGTWTVTGNLSAQSRPITYQVTLVSSPCSVTTPVGTFSVQERLCFIANNNSGQGSISGGSTSSKSAGQGVLIGVAANPVPADATFNMVFVAGDGNGNLVEFTGSGTVNNGTLKGTGSCSTTTPMCHGLSGTFSATLQ
jgi:hypothetical protein